MSTARVPSRPVPGRLLPVQPRARRRVERVAAATGVMGLAYLVWLVSGWPPGYRDAVGNFLFVPLLLLAVYTAFAAARRCAAMRQRRAAWLLVGLAATAYLGGTVAQAIGELPGATGQPAAEEPLYLAFYPLMLCAILLFSTRRPMRGDRARLGLDLAVVAIGGFAVVMYSVIGPAVADSSEEVLLSVAYPVGDLVLLVGLASLLLRNTAPSSVASLRLLALGLLLYAAGDLVYTLDDGALHLQRQQRDQRDVVRGDRPVRARRGGPGVARARLRAPSPSRRLRCAPAGRPTSPSPSASRCS